MSIKNRGIPIVVCVLAGSLCLMGAGPNVPAPSRSGESFPVGAFEDESVLVEAFVVEVNLPALAQQGVSPIGGQPHAVAVSNILKCLDTGQARVIGGAKVAARAGTKVEVETKRTLYIRQEKGTSQVAYSPYASNGNFAVDIEPVTESTVSARFEFASTRLIQKQVDANVPPVTESWEWNGSVVLQPGEPRIAGAAQESETAVFLLLVANRQGG